MSFWDLFKRKKEEVKEEAKIETKENYSEEAVKDTTQENKDGRTFMNKPCEICQIKDNEILGEIGYDKWTKQQGHYFHKKCFNIRKNQAKQAGLV